jgi:phosphatidylserine decarboxylase
MPAQPIRYLDRATRELKTEQIYGEPWLRLAYDNPVGRLFVWLLVRRRFVSAWYGWRMNRRRSAFLILPFIARYDLDVDEFAKSAFDYKTFNEFFHRALKPGSRPIAQGDDVAALPGDGRHLAFPDIGAAEGFYAKGSKFTLEELFAEGGQQAERRVLAARFAGGAMLISRLCPVDYHRFHFPVDGVPEESRSCRGSLYSVSPVALRRNLRALVENKRMFTLIESPAFGTVAMVEIGATNVGTIRQTFVPGRPARKGDEKGFFAFGGSCVITLFGRGRIQFDPDLVSASADCIETYARMGGSLGRATG